MTFKPIIKYIVVFFVVMLLFLLIITISNLIPRRYLIDNVTKSAEQLNEYEVMDYSAPLFYDAYKMDYYTDSVMLNVAYFTDPQQPLKAAMSASSYGWGLINLSTIKANIEPNTTYSRYWHGYQIFLRPMLLKFDYLQIGRINTFIFLLLLCACILVFYKRIGAWFSFVFIFTIAMLNIIILPINFQVITMFFISMISMLALSLVYDKKSEFLNLGFFITGMLTMFFDMYTCPLLSFGLPAIFLVLLHTKQQSISSKDMLKKVCIWFILWITAYVFTWLIKIVLAYLILGSQELETVKDSIYNRTSHALPEVTQQRINDVLSGFDLSLERIPLWIISLAVCVYMLLNRVTILLTGILILTGIILSIIFKHKKNSAVLPLLLIAFVPVLYYSFVINPTIIHYYFQYRSIGITFLGIICTLFIGIDFSNPRHK